MNDSSSLDRRYSFNITQGGHVAESTHLNGSTFSWGSVSPKLRSCSNLNNSTNSYFIGDLIVNSKNKHVTKVDARVAADVQSKGLASRIVKYHDGGARLNRSMSAHNLFSKPGQFPAVTLKKTNLPYRATKRELSMIRIPPPDKSSFYGNTVSSLLRSSSVIGLQPKQNEVLSTENRPIIHPPPTENDMAPTRSVLDVLKEISRKRINSDELESEETSKKYCSRASNDFVDTVANKALSNQQDFLGSPFSPCQRYKRQRDCMTPHQGIQVVEPRTSPEQAKKRVCNYNNDITSSLSSSVKSKKISTSRSLNQTLPKNGHPLEAQNSYSKNVDIRLINLENNGKNFSSNKPETEAIELQRSVSEPLIDLGGKVANGLRRRDHKPRLTLFNKKCDDNESSQTSDTYDLDENNLDNFNEEDYTGIPFVKPKKIASKSGLRNPVMERTQKSKLALMLSGLRGELYQNTDLDEVDSSFEKKQSQTIASTSTNIPTSSIQSTNNTNTLTAITTTSTATSVCNAEKITNTKALLPQLPLAVNKTSSLVGLKLKASSENISTILSTDTAKNTDLPYKPNVPVLGGFSFSTNNSSNTPAVQTLCSTSESKIIPTQISSVPISSSLPNNKIEGTSGNTQLPIYNNFIKFPTTTVLPTNNSNTVITSTSSTISNTSNNIANNPTSGSSFSFGLSNLPFGSTTNSSNIISVPVSSSAASSATLVFGTSTPSIVKPINSFHLAVPSTTLPVSSVSSAPIMFASPTNSATITKTAVSSENFFRSTNTPLSNFREMAKTSSEGISSLSFNINGNKSANTINAFGTVIDSTTNTLSMGTGISFNSDPKTQNLADQSNQKAENKGFNSSTPAPFDSQCFKTKTTESSISAFNNTTKSSENNILKPSVAPSIFASSSVKDPSEVFGSISNSTSGAVVTPSVFGNDKPEDNKSTPFSFVSNTVNFTAKNPTNVNTNTGGFSFISAVSNSGENSLSGQNNTSNNNFSGASVSVSQNNFIFGSSSNKINTSNIFGASTNKQIENLPQGGFSFGSTSLKTSPFNFGGGKTSDSTTDGFSANKAIPSFGATSDAKQNILSTNKPFSFGSPQPMHQKQSEPTNIGNPLNIFELSGATKATQPPAFNFTPGNSQPNVPTTNMFAPPTSNITTGPGDRPIRRATRRLQK